MTGSTHPLRTGRAALLTLTLTLAVILAACASQPAAETPAPATEPTAEATALPAGTAAPAPANTEAAGAPAEVSFARDVQPILESRCIRCHGGEKVEEGLVMRSYAELMTGSQNGPVIVPGDLQNSLLVEMIKENKMPKRGPKLTPVQAQVIFDWVAAGALDN